MINEKETTRTSKFLSLVLRHQPEHIGISLDDHGWTDVQILIEKANGSGVPLTMDILKYIVDTNPKKRFAFNDTFDKIRASQGHSVEVDLDYKPQTPPAILYHGTSKEAVAGIMATGLEKRQRHHVHLSADIETAIKVGQRHGKVIVFEVLTEQMTKDGYVFFVSENGVWLTESVPVKYLKGRE